MLHFSRLILPLPRLPRIAVALATALAIQGCDTPAPGAVPEPGTREPTTQGPAGAPPGSCWGRTVTPAVIETMTTQVQVTPARISPTGEIQSLPEYRTETRQNIVTPRIDNWFETPCKDRLTPDFIASLQRALLVRDFYGGPVSGVFNDATRRAMRAYQISAGGPDSPVLAIKTARSLGLIAVERTLAE